MNHWIIAPILLPALLAPIMAVAMRHDIVLARVAGLAGTVLLLTITGGLAMLAAQGGIHVYELGNWPAPFGIVLVLDRLSALMTVLTSALALIVLLYALGSGWDARGRHFHALFQFQLMGLMGAFLTGDAFNLFVFFEILLIASYGLIIHGGGGARLRAGLQYVVMNLAGSTLFLFALGTIYAVTGTLNMADLARVSATIPLEDSALLRTAVMLLIGVFAIKAALFPVQFWLPGAYSSASAPVAALFAIMTKVGAYAIVRFTTTVFGPNIAATDGMLTEWLLPAALVTLAVGALGVLGARRLGILAAFAVLASMGTLMVGVALITPQATAAAIYYLIHSTLAAAALFLVADLAVSRRGDAGGDLRTGPVIGMAGPIAALFFAAAIALAGLPPLSGFVGKLLILDAARVSGWVWAIWATVLIGSLVQVVGFARAGSTLFWKPHETAQDAPKGPAADAPSPALAVIAAAAAIGALILLTVLAGPVAGYADATARQLYDTPAYIGAVLAGGMR
ncbi:NADH dehydrogenase (quinone) [Oceaniovalibus guishaninsula JLT2003]|uniref:NADH dehydrogenase (Quinone) n=1 Tax=Oceaniovalibus guishaninsula JLT2003 TaxID=1231392 RepID=K2HAD9_9RHOB|nr:monovalent cation/H+ antiporter subunit D [Oceaniovalibus guishaninsula]EKE44493.1 NADH dehydrogenase (quinone) [Oceaniovalibus guishaninsula JLT2003]